MKAESSSACFRGAAARRAPRRGRLAAALGLAALALTACAQDGAPSAPDFHAISTEAEFRAALADRTMVFSNGTRMVAQADGRLSGATAAGPLSGAWRFADASFCRAALINGAPAPKVCNPIAVSEKAVRFDNADGTIFATADLD